MPFSGPGFFLAAKTIAMSELRFERIWTLSGLRIGQVSKEIESGITSRGEFCCVCAGFEENFTLFGLLEQSLPSPCNWSESISFALLMDRRWEGHEATQQQQQIQQHQQQCYDLYCSLHRKATSFFCVHCYAYQLLASCVLLYLAAHIELSQFGQEMVLSWPDYIANFQESSCDSWCKLEHLRSLKMNDKCSFKVSAAPWSGIKFTSGIATLQWVRDPLHWVSRWGLKMSLTSCSI